MSLNFNWASWSEFWAMGGYGLYVWGSFAVSAILVAAELAAIAARRAALRERADSEPVTGDRAS